MNHYHQPVMSESAARALVLALVALAPIGAAAVEHRVQNRPSTQPLVERPAPAAQSSSLDALMFYQLLIAEMELQNGRPQVAIEVLLDAGRRSRDEALFQRAIEIALQARSAEQALAATRAWRASLPESRTALRYQAQILGATGRVSDAAEPVGAWLRNATPTERLGILAALPRIFVRGADGRAGAQMIEQVVQPYLDVPEAREAALVSIGRSWLLAGDEDKALARAQQAASADPASAGAALLALELMPRAPAAEDIIRARLKAGDVEPALRLAYVRVLTQQQRLSEAAAQLQLVTAQQPRRAGPWLTLGAVELELRHPAQAELALRRYLELAGAPRDAAAADEEPEDPDRVVQARLMLAQAAEMQRDFAGAEAQLALITDRERMADVQARRASLLVRQGRWEQARELIRSLPADTPSQARSRSLAEAHMLREARQWGLAYQVLASEIERASNDVDLLYEQAMMAEKLGRLDEMESLLRRVIALKPDHQHAYNALGYALADRGQRLPEARELIVKALSFTPGDPFITDSLAWVEFRMGRPEEALRLLRQAYGARPDTEIAAHLGEVLWVLGQKDEARRVWNEGRQRDPDNEVLRETMTRLKP
jgi:tetratricopeptide (TPR) repeat protein